MQDSPIDSPRRERGQQARTATEATRPPNSRVASPPPPCPTTRSLTEFQPPGLMPPFLHSCNNAACNACASTSTTACASTSTTFSMPAAIARAQDERVVEHPPPSVHCDLRRNMPQRGKCAAELPRHNVFEVMHSVLLPETRISEDAKQFAKFIGHETIGFLTSEMAELCSQDSTSGTLQAQHGYQALANLGLAAFIPAVAARVGHSPMPHEEAVKEAQATLREKPLRPRTASVVESSEGAADPAVPPPARSTEASWQAVTARPVVVPAQPFACPLSPVCNLSAAWPADLMRAQDAQTMRRTMQPPVAMQPAIIMATARPLAAPSSAPISPGAVARTQTIAASPAGVCMPPALLGPANVSAPSIATTAAASTLKNLMEVPHLAAQSNRSSVSTSGEAAEPDLIKVIFEEFFDQI